MDPEDNLGRKFGLQNSPSDDSLDEQKVRED